MIGHFCRTLGRIAESGRTHCGAALIGRLFIAGALTCLLSFLTVQLWNFLRDTDTAKIALITETEAYATRSRLVQQLDSLLQGLREVHDYWAANAPEAIDGWAEVQGLGFAELDGLSALLWVDEATGRQFLATPEAPEMYRPASPVEEATAERLQRGAAGVVGEAMLGPEAVDEGQRIKVVIRRDEGGGTLIAALDAQAMFASFLQDQSPGYAVEVEWRGQSLYRQGAPAAGIPESWSREGMIRTSMNALLAVTHTPTAALAAALVTPAVAAVMPLGLAVSVLVGMLVVENGRVNTRAAAAREAERRVGELNRTLESQVAERTAELQTRNADLVTIAESVSHDLRSPLNALSVNLELIGQDMASSSGREAQDALRRCMTGVRRMASILDRVVGLSMAVHSTFQREPLSMRGLVLEVFEQLRAVAPEATVELEVAPLVDVAADDVLVRILILNLLGNALEHGGARIRVSCESAGAGKPVVYRIDNDGCDVDPGRLDTLFRLFHTGDDPQHERGRGLGLAIAERVVKRHGGHIQADTDRGDRFTIRFTLEPDAAA